MKRWLKPADPVLMLAAAAFAGFSWLALLSATSGGWSPSGMAVRQAGYILLGLVVMHLVSCLDYRRVRYAAWPIYVLVLLLLVAVMLPGVGQAAKGAQRWISLGPLGTLQPSEPAKLAVVLLLAHYLASRLKHHRTFRVKWLAGCLAIAGVPFLLVAAQPDLGTGIVIMALAFVMLFQAGASPIHLGGIVFAGLGILPLVLKEYQRHRLLVFLNPSIDPQGTGYNIMQSQTAIGSGGIWGTGLFYGPMSQRGFVPENHTDFLLTVVGEEAGLVGTLALLALFLLLCFALVRITVKAIDLLGVLLGVGVTSLMGLQALINIGMVVGALPVVGLPLPLASFGGSAMVTNFAALGLAASISRVSREPDFAREVCELD